jgi:rhodanese-related sulfurtransferase
VDRTAVFLDARTAEEFRAGSLPGAGNIPLRAVQADGLQKVGAALLPNDDFNTRVVVFGRDGAQARALAEAIAQNARHNVAYFPGTFDALRMAVK